jgi:release factor glutamine methyltransferase
VKTLLDIVNLSTAFLEQKGFRSPRRDVLELVSDVLAIRPLDVYMQFDRPLEESELERCRAALRRRATGEPIQYIRGKVDFFDCQIAVNRDVLIPRQETELLVDLISKRLQGRDLSGKKLWDLCCGSGCIGIALKKAFPDLHVALSDLSLAALQVAQRNGSANGVDVEWHQGDLLAPFVGQRADFIVCNPPYIAEEEFAELEIEVRDFEPRGALVAPELGLAFYRRLAAEISQFLVPHGQLWLEIGATQGERISALFAGVAAKSRVLLQDLAGRDRFFVLELE